MSDEAVQEAIREAWAVATLPGTSFPMLFGRRDGELYVVVDPDAFDSAEHVAQNAAMMGADDYGIEMAVSAYQRAKAGVSG